MMKRFSTLLFAALLAVTGASAAEPALPAKGPAVPPAPTFIEKPEGTVVVFRQSGPSGYEYMASIHPEDWAKLPK